MLQSWASSLPTSQVYVMLLKTFKIIIIIIIINCNWVIYYIKNCLRYLTSSETCTAGYTRTYHNVENKLYCTDAATGLKNDSVIIAQLRKDLK
jgi:hypothetical protein